MCFFQEEWWNFAGAVEGGGQTSEGALVTSSCGYLLKISQLQPVHQVEPEEDPHFLEQRVGVHRHPLPWGKQEHQVRHHQPQELPVQVWRVPQKLCLNRITKIGGGFKKKQPCGGAVEHDTTFNRTSVILLEVQYVLTKRPQKNSRLNDGKPDGVIRAFSAWSSLYSWHHAFGISLGMIHRHDATKASGAVTSPPVPRVPRRKGRAASDRGADTKRFLRLWDSTSRWRFRCIMDKVFHRRSRGRSCLLARCFTVHWWLVSSSLFWKKPHVQLGECCLGHQAQALVLLVC